MRTGSTTKDFWQLLPWSNGRCVLTWVIGFDNEEPTFIKKSPNYFDVICLSIITNPELSQYFDWNTSFIYLLMIVLYYHKICSCCLYSGESMHDSIVFQQLSSAFANEIYYIYSSFHYELTGLFYMCHAILKCNFHAEARHSLFQLIASHLPLQEPINEVEIFTTVMTNKNPVILNALGKFVYQEFKRREQEARYNNA